VRKAATNVSNVVTYVAVVRFANASGRLLPGMTANVRVVTESRESVLKVPNAALRVRVPGVEPASAGPADAPAAPASPGRAGRIHLLDAKGQPVAYPVRLGVSDGTATELLVAPGSSEAGVLVEGAQVVTGVTAKASGPRTSGPRMSF
jgi:HlyD family secretion protein